MNDMRTVVFTTAVAISCSILYLVWRKRRCMSNWKEVAIVDKLFIHPVKSCRGISVDNFVATEKNVMLSNSDIGDRTFMMVHEYGRFATIRQFPQMVLIKASIIGINKLRLEAPGMRAFEIEIPIHGSGKVLNYKVWGTRCPGVDCGDEAAAWLAEFTGVNTARLVFHNKQLPSREGTKLLEFGHLGVYSETTTKSTFQDYSPFNLVSQASVDLLNTKLDGDHQVTERNFRPNVLLKGCSAFAEDNWKRIKIGSAEFVFAKHCTRCHVTTVNPETGIKDEDLNTLKTLSTFRMCKPEERPLYGIAPKFSVDFVNIKPGEISVGDKVYLFEDDNN
uniref:mitochondrial amidoxime reducing component 2-like n=1 Tax=Styela clava TaxID=7725 RepID=UPI00193A4228|nr:mitochondrial amidoxime reducing component 2-like [Styela clava]